MSYFIRKLKLDLKMAYQSFVREFVQPPNNGLRLLLTLLKNLLCQSANPVGGSVPKSAGLATLRMEEYKKTMVDEHDCLLCIKYTLRVMHAREELIEDNSGLLTVASCLLSNFSKSRVTALEILSLLLTGPSSVDKVLDAFTSMRIKHAESTRFKMLIGMMYIKGAPNVIFQVSCLRLLNSLLNLCRSANMRVFLQYEMEEAGLDCNRLQESCQGDGLEFDDLRKEIREWKSRYIDVSCLLRKIRSDMRAEGNNVAVTEFNYDQQFGSMYSKYRST
ncbi:formin-like protein 1 [Aplysia californica]|uniref:Formin-like protein 1 n=1 Tax=Aplysia californica TaxID=6500 RepID=A0ABM1ABV6_APLCA|nr:formin-like protein 1 [Aplysia californica]